MTDEELKALVASLAVAQKETNEEMRRNNADVKQFMKETNEIISRNSAEIRTFMQKTDEQISRTEATVEKVSKLLGNIRQNQGHVSEDFFYHSLQEDIRLGDIRFDNIAKNLHDQRGKTQGEYDIVMTNGNAVGIVEVKYKAHENDLDKLERKMKNFKKLFPVYKNLRV